MSIKKTLTTVADIAIDALEKTSSPASRAGVTVERTGKLVEAKVDPDVIALQLSKNSKNGHIYTRTHVDALTMLYEDSKTTVGITAAQTSALIRDQNRELDQDLDPVPQLR